MTPYFLTKLEMSPDDDGKGWTLEHELIYHSMSCTVVVPRGFRTDLASIPRMVWSILPPQSIPRPSVLHDWLYLTKEYDRKTCDILLLEAMMATNTGAFARNLIYRAVRMFGGSHY